jgi:hypothetical protein
MKANEIVDVLIRNADTAPSKLSFVGFGTLALMLAVYDPFITPSGYPATPCWHPYNYIKFAKTY